MPLPASWVDPLLAKLTLRYGQAFMRQYADLDPGMVKADWAEVLDGFERHPAALRYAVDNLPDTPPNAMQFRAIARRAPPPDVAALPAPQGEAPPPQIGQLARTMRGKRPDRRSPAQQCIDNVERIVANRGGKISDAQRHLVAHCLRVPGTTTTLPVRRAGEVQHDQEIAA